MNKTTYQLDNAEAQQRKWQLEIPERVDRDNLHPGDLAKLIFLADALHGERMWVDVEGRTDDGHYIGRLDNDPVFMAINAGDVVRFGPEHVIAIMTSNEADAMRDSLLG